MLAIVCLVWDPDLWLQRIWRDRAAEGLSTTHTNIGDPFRAFRSVFAISIRRRLTGSTARFAWARPPVTVWPASSANASAGGTPSAACACRRRLQALPTLAKHLELELPPPRDVSDPTVGPAVPAKDVPDTKVACPLEDRGPVSLDPVGDDDDRRLWEALMATHHPLGWARPPNGIDLRSRRC